jgi:hypothetical protein
LRKEKRAAEIEIHRLDKHITGLEAEYGSQLREKTQFINTLSSNQSKEEVEQLKQLKHDYEVKLALLSQEIERQEFNRQRQTAEVEELRRQLQQQETKYIASMKDSSYHNRTLETLSQEI